MNNVHAKTGAAGLGGAVSIIVVWLLGQFDVEVSVEVASAITTVFAFAASYVKTA